MRASSVIPTAVSVALDATGNLSIGYKDKRIEYRWKNRPVVIIDSLNHLGRNINCSEEDPQSCDLLLPVTHPKISLSDFVPVPVPGPTMTVVDLMPQSAYRTSRHVNVAVADANQSSMKRFTPPFTLTQQKVTDWQLSPKSLPLSVDHGVRARPTPPSSVPKHPGDHVAHGLCVCRQALSDVAHSIVGLFGHGPSLSSAVNNGTLGIHYLTIVEAYTLERLEVWLHVVPLTIGWATAARPWPVSP